MARMVYYSVSAERSRLIQREQLILLEIGRDEIDSASAFVEYLGSEYGFSKSSVWYNLNRLKEKGLLDFASKDSVGKPLMLTQAGLSELGKLEPFRNKIAAGFSETLLNAGGRKIDEGVVRNMRGFAWNGGV
ncbi:MAG: MarR family transcriptional regulator [Candidatus Micrarchaeia archaeon]